MPAKKKVAGAQAVAFKAKKARNYLPCANCGKPEVVYCNKILTIDQLAQLHDLKEHCIVVCGTPLGDDYSGMYNVHRPASDL